MLGGLVPEPWWEEASFPLTGRAVGWCVAGRLQEACLPSLRVCRAWCWGEVSRCCQQLHNAGPGSIRRPSRASSLISAPWGQELTSPGYCSGLTAPTPEAQVRSQAGELRFPKMFVMALKGIKGNTQKQKIKRDTKDEPHTSGKCKIRPKKKKTKGTHTHTHTHTHRQPK